MPLDAYNATAADFDSAAQRHANSFWGWAIAAALIGWIAGVWWALIPGAMALLRVVQSSWATIMAGRLRNGTYRLPNPNNGAPDGDAANRAR